MRDSVSLIARRNLTVVGVLAIALTALSCAAEPSENVDPPTVTAPAATVAYPSLHYSWDVVPGIDASAVDAARFAAETNALSAEANVSESAARLRRARVVPVYDDWQEERRARESGSVWTGGSLYRAVSATASGDDGGFMVTVCNFPTPGTYGVEADGNLKSPSRSGPPWSNVEMAVQKTTEPAADGSTSSTPRWLQVRNPEAMDLSAQAQADRQALCDRYAPDPLVQHPPAPLSPR